MSRSLIFLHRGISGAPVWQTAAVAAGSVLCRAGKVIRNEEKYRKNLESAGWMHYNQIRIRFFIFFGGIPFLVLSGPGFGKQTFER
jgi:hypothetical protein